MGNCFCSNENNQQIIVKNEVNIPYSDSNFSSTKFDTDKEKKTKTLIRLKTNRKSTDAIVPSSLVSTEIFIRSKSKKSNYNEQVKNEEDSVLKSDNRNSPDKRGSKSRREYLYKELSDINSMPINERKSSNTSSVIEPREIENTIIMQSPQDEDKNELAKEITNCNDEYNKVKTEEKMQIEETVNQAFTKEDEKQLRIILLSHFIFRHFSKETIKKIIDSLTLVQIESGLFLFNKNEEATAFYIIKSGLVRIIDDTNSRLLKTYNTFGEISLCKSEQIRRYSAKAESTLEVFILDKNYYLALEEVNRYEMYKDSFNRLCDNFYLFNLITEEEKEDLLEISCIESYPTSQTPVQWNPNSTNKKCIFVSQGKLKISNKLNSNMNEVCNEGSFFGFSNLLVLNSNMNNQSCLITTVNANTEIIFIYEKMLIEVFGINYMMYLSDKCFSTIIDSDYFLSKVVKNSKIPLAIIPKLFLMKTYNKNDIIFSKGLCANKKAFIILAGTISGNKNISVIAKSGSFFRSDLLITSYEFEDDIIASRNLFTYETSYQHIINVLKKNNINVSYLSLIYSLMNTFPIFAQMKLKDIINIANHIKAKTYYKREIILQQKQSVKFLYLIAKGTVKLTVGKEGKKVKILEQGNTFGEFNILSSSGSSYNYVAKSDEVIVYLINKDYFIELLSENIINEFILKKSFLEENNISLNDLYYLSYLGRGRFGNVCLVHNEVCFYAIKAISKTFAEKQKFGVKYLLFEKETLCSLDHPFVLKLVKTLKNDNWLFFLMEHIKGMNMNEYLDSRKMKKNIYETKFYAGCLFLAISYLHSKNIVHRDIKPSNLMIDSNGYVKVIDFGTAKKIKKGEKTKTVIGTPNFIAPEVLTGKGYSFSCDYWSIGICIYYIFYGKLPFGNNSIEIMDTYKEILEKEVEFPDKNNNEINSLVSSLLEKDEKKRNTDFKNIKTHLLFSDFNWDELIQYKVKPPFVPGRDSRHNTDNLKNKNLPFVMFMENERSDTKQTVTLKFNSSAKKAVNTKPINFACNIPKNWFEDF